MRRIKIFIIALLCALFFVACGSEIKASGLPEVYAVTFDSVKKNLISPSSAVFPKYDESFVKYSRSELKDLGTGQELYYRVYTVNSYVDSDNAYGTKVRTYYTADVYCYDDDLRDFFNGSKGLNKGVEDHYYIFITSME